MTSLAEVLLAEHQRDALIADCVKLVHQQIDNSGPVRRLTLKAGVGVLNSIRPNGLHWAVGRLLPDFVTALDPLYQRFRTSSDRDFSLFLRKNSEEAVEALLGATDQRAAGSQNSTLRVGYQRMRPMAQAQVREALPGLSKILSGYLN